MTALDTRELLNTQPFCNSFGVKSFVALAAMGLPDDPGEAGRWTKVERERRGISAAELASRINGLARFASDPTTVSQQVVSKFEQGGNKRLPPWTRFIASAFEASDSETKEDPYLHMGLDDRSVEIQRLPTWAGLGTGGTGEGDPGTVSFSRDLVERELRAQPDALLAIEAEGNSMEPDFQGGDQILVDTRRKSLANAGAFCLWDGDGHVIKYIEKVPDSDPPKVLVISKNRDLYEPKERLLDDISVVGRVVWFGRRVQ